MTDPTPWREGLAPRRTGLDAVQLAEIVALPALLKLNFLPVAILKAPLAPQSTVNAPLPAIRILLLAVVAKVPPLMVNDEFKVSVPDGAVKVPAERLKAPPTDTEVRVLRSAPELFIANVVAAARLVKPGKVVPDPIIKAALAVRVPVPLRTLPVPSVIEDGIVGLLPRGKLQA